jgi:K+:H+ antiporter
MLTSVEITTFILAIGLMLLSAKVLGEIFNKIKQPAVIGEILAGIILGPSIFGYFLPDIYRWIFASNNEIQIAVDGITTISVILLLLVSGLEVDLSVVLAEGKKAFYIGIMGVVIPFMLGFSITYLYPELMGMKNSDTRIIYSLFIGTALSISALPVIAKTLLDMNLLQTKIGSTIIASAMFNDVIGWLIFSLILSIMGLKKSTISFALTLSLMIIFSLIILTAGKKLINRIIPLIQNKFSFPGGILNFIIISGFLCAAFTEFIGVHAIFGAFIIGIAIGGSEHLNEKTRELIQQFVTNIFAPLFFVSIGLKVNFLTNFNPLIVLTVLILAFTGKVFGCSFGAKLSGIQNNEALAIGFGMNSRGAMEIILGVLALEAGIIDESLFVALVIMALVTSLTSAPMMDYFINKGGGTTLIKLLKAKNILFSNHKDKESIIKELLQKLKPELNISIDYVFKAVVEREKISATGISNHLAIPHAKIKLEKPAIALAINKSGIDFNAIDGIPSTIIFLLLTPENKPELQLRLLAEISSKFVDITFADKILKAKTHQDVIKLFY